jgi:hypothetical protein
MIKVGQIRHSVHAPIPVSTQLVAGGQASKQPSGLRRSRPRPKGRQRGASADAVLRSILRLLVPPVLTRYLGADPAGRGLPSRWVQEGHLPASRYSLFFRAPGEMSP